MATNNATNYKPSQYNVQVGGASGTLSNVAPSATAGVPVISGGAAANPTFGTAVVAGGGTGIVAAGAAYAPICAGTTTTSAFQTASTGIGTSGFILTSNGASALPSFQAPAASSISITGNSGGALTGAAFTFTGGTTGLTFSGSGSTETLTGTLVVANGGTGVATMTTAYAPVCAGTTATGALQVASTGLATSGFVLTSNGASALPSFQAVAGGSVTLAGNTGSATGSTITLDATTNSGKTVVFSGSSSTMSLLVTDGSQNTLVGAAAGLGATITGTGNTSLGNSTLSVLTGGVGNTVIGANSGTLISSAQDTTILGAASGVNITTLNRNTIIGSGSFAGSGTSNTIVGYGSFTGVSGGSARNTALGFGVGGNYTGTESNNVLIQNNGVVGDSHVMRIGTSGSGNFQVNTCYIAGIDGVTVTGGTAVLVNGSDQLGTVVSSRKYKQNILDMADQSEIIYQLRPVTFNYNKFPDEPAWGLIAEEVSEVFPALTIYKDGEPETVRYHELSTLLLNEVQKLAKRVAQLELALSKKD